MVKARDFKIASVPIKHLSNMRESCGHVVTDDVM